MRYLYLALLCCICPLSAAESLALPVSPLSPMLTTTAGTSVSGAAEVLPPAKGTLPVICYHRFGPEESSDPLKISAKRLAEELRWLKKEGYQSITTQQALDFVDGKGDSLPAKPIILSVDDGYRSGWSVGGPIFKRYGFKAVYFIITDQVGVSKNFLNWDDLKEILAEGFEVQSHTMDHTNLGKPLSFKIPIDGEVHPEEFSEKHVTKFEMPLDYHTRLRTELEGSREKLDEMLGETVTTLAYPFGAFNPVVESYAVDSGYNLIMTVSGGVNIPGDDPHRLRRIILVGHPTLESFKKKVLEKRLLAKIQGLEEGIGIFSDQLPHKITITMPPDRDPNEVPRGDIQGHWINLKPGAAPSTWVATLEKKMKPGFYFFKVEVGSGATFARDSYLFEIYRPGMRNYMIPLSPTSQP